MRHGKRVANSSGKIEVGVSCEYTLWMNPALLCAVPWRIYLVDVTCGCVLYMYQMHVSIPSINPMDLPWQMQLTFFDRAKQLQHE